MIADRIRLYNLRTGNPLRLKAVFFDMDGVLFDSMSAHAESWIYAFSQFGIAFTPREVYLNEGRTGGSTVDETFLREKGRHATDAEKKEIYRIKSEKFDSLEHFTLVDGIETVLEKVRQSALPAYIVTGSGQQSLFEKVNLHFQGLFSRDRMITAEDVTIGKPNPEPYLKALEKSRLLPHEAVVIENAPLGILSATRAGIFTIGVNTGILPDSELEAAHADIVYPDMSTLARKWDDLILNA